MKKTFLYYGTEENCFETEKFETTNPIEDVRQFLKDDYLQTDEIEAAAYQMQCDFEKQGYAMYETTQGQGYDIIIGIAEQGHCRKILLALRRARREAIEMFY